jgi:thiol-disulfide isomerase/thioredoxin
MNKILLTCALAFLALPLLAQPIKVKISGKVLNPTTDSVKISQFFGDHYVDYLGSKLNKKGEFSLKGQLPAKDFYVLRVGGQRLNLVLRDSAELKIYTDARNVQAFSNITGSQESVNMNEFISRMAAFNNYRDSAIAMVQREPQREQEIGQTFQNEYFQFAAYRGKFISLNQNSPALMPVISSLDADKEFETYESLVKQLNQGFGGSPSIENLNHQFSAAKIKHDAASFLATGNMAPDFTQNDVNGKPLSLSDLRGKVVLLDFWASWCGPCRKENPNVVALYDKYKDAGFTVMSVSLDNNRDNWLAAIKKDNLSWPNHVSDLRQWQNEVAKLYRVSGIPFTVLIDKDGKVIDTKLRGMALEQALKTIFGF